MLAQFSIWPLDNPHMSPDIARIATVLDRLECTYELGPMNTTIEGTWPEVMNAIQACHEVLRESHNRVLTNITIDDDSTRPQSLAESAAKISEERNKPTT